MEDSNMSTDWEFEVKRWMSDDNRAAVEGARDTELALKANGAKFSQSIIDLCNAWLKNPVAQ